MERDEESGLNYHTARYYAPWITRWMSCDPIGMKGGVNLYVYCDGNPTNRTDKLGSDWEFTWDPREWAPIEFAKEEVIPRAVGGVKVAAGAAGFVAGAALCETGVGCVAGAPLMVASADVAGSGATQVITGKPAPTALGVIAGEKAQIIEEDIVNAAGLAHLAAEGVSLWKTGKPLASKTPTDPKGEKPATPARGNMSGRRGASGNALQPLSKAEMQSLENASKGTMKKLGIPEKNIGAGEAAGRGKAFDPNEIDMGGNLPSTATTRGIWVGRGVLEYIEGFPVWNRASMSERLEAVIAHEWTEFTLRTAEVEKDLAHDLAVLMSPGTPLPISAGAREILSEQTANATKQLSR
jgi:RHS repeat-associated protein